MTRKDITKIIKLEQNRIKNYENQITDIKFDIKGCKKAVTFWKKELKKTEK